MTFLRIDSLLITLAILDLRTFTVRVKLISCLKSKSLSFRVVQGGSSSNLNMNLYATKKTAAEGMLDIALFLANITHMKTVIEQGAGYRYGGETGTLCLFCEVCPCVFVT